MGFRVIAGVRCWPSFPGLGSSGRCPITTAAPSTALTTIQPAFTDAERFALVAGYRGLTREAYALELRQFTTWCRARSVSLFAVRRADIETFARDREARGRARATITRRLSTIAGFCKGRGSKKNSWTAPRPPMSAGRGLTTRPHAVALDRNELGALLVARRIRAASLSPAGRSCPAPI